MMKKILTLSLVLMMPTITSAQTVTNGFKVSCQYSNQQVQVSHCNLATQSGDLKSHECILALENGLKSVISFHAQTHHVSLKLELFDLEGNLLLAKGSVQPLDNFYVGDLWMNLTVKEHDQNSNEVVSCYSLGKKEETAPTSPVDSADDLDQNYRHF